MKFARPTVLALAGLDPVGRAGLTVDLSTIGALGGRALGIATALTAQGRRTFGVYGAPPEIVKRQIRAVLELAPISAVKLGMVPDAAAMRAVRSALAQQAAPWVVDPVVRTAQGHPLSTLAARDYLALASPDVLLTPNAIEAAWLLGQRAAIRDLEEALRAAIRLVRYGFGAVVVKGGHLRTGATDLLCVPDAALYLWGPKLSRSPTRHRGTGCRFASALATELAKGSSMAGAAQAAKQFVERFLGGRETAVEDAARQRRR